MSGRETVKDRVWAQIFFGRAPSVCVCDIEPVPLWEQVRLKGPQYYLLHAMKLAFDLNLTSSIERARR